MGYEAKPTLGLEPGHSDEFYEMVSDRLTKIVEEVKEDSKDAKARFKLDVMFFHDRSMTKPHLGVITAWHSGGYMNGGGDYMIYFCPTKTDDDDGQCFAPIDTKLLTGGLAVCTKCRTAHDPADLIWQIRARLRVDGWAKLITRMFYRLETNADIRVGYFRKNLIEAYQNLKVGDDGESLDRVKGDHVWTTYSLFHLMRDVHAGADVYNRIKALLSA